jgi:hypothetical protein
MNNGGYENKMQRTEFPPALVKICCSKLLQGEIGVFAVRNLKKGTIIGYVERFGEEFYTWDDYAKLDRQTKRMVDKFCARTKDGFWGPEDINYIPPVWHMNHSCAGNVAFDKDDNFATIRNVQGGGELCFDYGLLISYPRFRLECKCNAPSCRGIITGNDWQDPAFRRKNMNIMSEGMRELCLQRSDDE